ncbi:MAG: SDR family NAD(P)-dependent oxidoreductase [Roseibium sp.]|uniref:SDR family NAD(P)-dependent oxidoreductase n=1 Tax=Roseibium sp. TaxID=1936156 RepID=UPI003D9C19D7
MTSNQTVLVTGGNRGIGLAIVERFAAEGYSVFLSGRDGASVVAEAQRLRDRGHNVTPLEMDVADRESIKAAIGSLAASVDVLINNAGVLPDGDLMSLSDAEIDLSFAVNVLGPLELARLLAPGMAERAYGRIVNVSSDWGSFEAGMGGPGAYGVTKAALNALTVRLSKDLPETTKTNAMNPGWVRTRMGGQNATRTPEMAADTAFWLGTLPEDGPNGGFFFDRKSVDW